MCPCADVPGGRPRPRAAAASSRHAPRREALRVQSSIQSAREIDSATRRHWHGIRGATAR